MEEEVMTTTTILDEGEEDEAIAAIDVVAMTTMVTAGAVVEVVALAMTTMSSSRPRFYDWTTAARRCSTMVRAAGEEVTARWTRAFLKSLSGLLTRTIKKPFRLRTRRQLSWPTARCAPASSADDGSTLNVYITFLPPKATGDDL